jgi:hypothetical protein
MRIGPLLATIVAAVSATAVVAQPASANSPGTVVNGGSGMCLQPLPGPFQTIWDGSVRVAQMPCNGSPEQKWLPVLLGTGKNPLYACSGIGCPVVTPEPYYYLVNSLTNLCLDVTYVNSRTAKCLDIPWATNDAAYIWQWHCTGGNVAQAFTFPG